MTWVMIVWTALMAVWIIAGIASADPEGNCTEPGAISQKTCEEASNAGTGIGVGILIFLWFLVFVPLCLVWFMTRPKGRECPACGERVKRGLLQCPGCGHDFAAAAATAPLQRPPA